MNNGIDDSVASAENLVGCTRGIDWKDGPWSYYLLISTPQDALVTIDEPADHANQNAYNVHVRAGLEGDARPWNAAVQDSPVGASIQMQTKVSVAFEPRR